MGWSCGHIAGKTLDLVTAACLESTNVQNTYTTRGKKYLIDVSRVEHHDGAITGSIYNMLPNNMCKKSGSFRIEPDGSISRGPKWMKDAASAQRRANDRQARAEYAREQEMLEQEKLEEAMYENDCE